MFLSEYEQVLEEVEGGVEWAELSEVDLRRSSYRWTRRDARDRELIFSQRTWIAYHTHVPDGAGWRSR